MGRWSVAAFAAGSITAIGAWFWTVDDEGIAVPGGLGIDSTPLQISAFPSVREDSAEAMTPAPSPRSATPPAAVPTSPVRIDVKAPRKLRVGEVADLAVDVGENPGVSEVRFTVRSDADVLQVRAGTQGDWAVAPGASPRFAIDISVAEDRVDVVSRQSGQRLGLTGGSVATVQLQAVAPGATSVLVSDVVVRDLAGRMTAAAVSSSNLQVVVDSAPR